MLYRELRDRFIKFNREHPNATPLKGFIVFSAENWPKTYSEKSRTYEVHSDNKAFRPNASSCSLFGSSLDGTDQGVRLDWYMADFGIPGGWAVERCIIKEPVTRVDFTPNDIEAVYDEADRRIDAEIRDGDFTDEKGEIHMDAVDDCRADMLQGVYSVLMTLSKDWPSVSQMCSAEEEQRGYFCKDGDSECTVTLILMQMWAGARQANTYMVLLPM